MRVRILYKMRLLLGNRRKPYFVFSELVGHPVRNTKLYEQALMHKSYHGKERSSYLSNNERLEFLGDSILSSIVSDILYRKYPNKNEGFLTNCRSRIVQRESLNKIAVAMGLDKLITSSREVPQQSQDIFGNALEAFVGAVYLDLGYENAKLFVENKLLKQQIDIDEVSKQEVNFKSRLLEWGQQNRVTMDYELLDSFHSKNNQTVFRYRVIFGHINGEEGEGCSKKSAQQEASQKTLDRLNHDTAFRNKVIKNAAPKPTKASAQKKPQKDKKQTEESSCPSQE